VRRHRALVAAAALVMLAGCGGDDDPGTIGGDDTPQPVEDTDETSVETADGDADDVEDIDVTVVPDEITEAYVEAVLAELEQIRHEALVEFRENGYEITLEVADRSSSIFTTEGTDFHAADLSGLAERGFENYLPADEMEPVQPEVEELLSSTDECIFVETEVSHEGRLAEPGDPVTRLYHLVLQQRELVEDYNKTPWVIAMIPADVDYWREEDPCAE
jgi:hypothetical protein